MAALSVGPQCGTLCVAAAFQNRQLLVCQYSMAWPCVQGLVMWPSVWAQCSGPYLHNFKMNRATNLIFTHHTQGHSIDLDQYKGSVVTLPYLYVVSSVTLLLISECFRGGPVIKIIMNVVVVGIIPRYIFQGIHTTDQYKLMKSSSKMKVNLYVGYIADKQVKFP